MGWKTATALLATAVVGTVIGLEMAAWLMI